MLLGEAWTALCRVGCRKYLTTCHWWLWYISCAIIHQQWSSCRSRLFMILPVPHPTPGNSHTGLELACCRYVAAAAVVKTFVAAVNTRWPGATRANATNEAVSGVACRLIPRPCSQHRLVLEILCSKWLVARVDGAGSSVLVFGLSLTLLLSLHLAFCFTGCPGEGEVDLLSKAHLLGWLLIVIVAVIVVRAVTEDCPAAPACAPSEGSREKGLPSW